MLNRIFQLLLAACLVTGTLLAADDPSVGKWKVNPSKSEPTDQMKVDVAGANKYTLTFAPDAVDTIVADGSDPPALRGTTLSITVEGLLYRSTLNELAGHLDPMRFIRVHRSSIVNIDSILELQPISHGEFELVLKDGHRSRVSRTYRIQLEKRLGQSL